MTNTELTAIIARQEEQRLKPQPDEQPSVEADVDALLAEVGQPRNASLEFILRVLAAVAFENTDDLWWRTDGQYAPVTFFVKCSDLFWWGCADLEEITPENVHLLEEAFRDCRATDPKLGELYASDLFCCRVRKMRPQGCCYPDNDSEALWPLFDACGPEREVGVGNPYPRGQRPRVRKPSDVAPIQEQ